MILTGEAVKTADREAISAALGVPAWELLRLIVDELLAGAR